MYACMYVYYILYLKENNTLNSHTKFSLKSVNCPFAGVFGERNLTSLDRNTTNIRFQRCSRQQTVSFYDHNNETVQGAKETIELLTWETRDIGNWI